MAQIHDALATIGDPLGVSQGQFLKRNVYSFAYRLILLSSQSIGLIEDLMFLFLVSSHMVTYFSKSSKKTRDLPILVY